MSEVGCRAAEQQRFCRPWEGLQGSRGSAGPGKGCRAAEVLQALARASMQQGSRQAGTAGPACPDKPESAHIIHQQYIWDS